MPNLFGNSHVVVLLFSPRVLPSTLLSSTSPIHPVNSIIHSASIIIRHNSRIHLHQAISALPTTLPTMRITLAVIGSLVAFAEATPAGQAFKQVPSKVNDKVRASRTSGPDGNWHIGCDKNNSCSYYEQIAAATQAAVPITARDGNTTFKRTECRKCTLSPLYSSSCDVR